MGKLTAFINNKRVVQLFCGAILLLFLTACLVWQVYAFTQLGLRAIKWHTHLLEYVYVWLAGVFIFRILGGRNFSEKTKKLFLGFSSIVFVLGMVETFLGLTGMVTTYLERQHGGYVSVYEQQIRPRYHAWPAADYRHALQKPEYFYWRPTNACGFADEEWRVDKKPHEKRLLALGDSFTEGDGTPFDSTYVVLLQQKLMAAGDSFYVMNAGVAGSDPFDNYINLKERLLVYQPDVIIQTISATDLTADIRLRGGMERFQPNGTQKFKPAPWWEPLYAVSYISRLFFKAAGYTQLLRKERLSAEEENTLNTQVSALLKEYALLCRQNHIRLLLLLRPDRKEIKQHTYAFDFSVIKTCLKADSSITVIDLMPAYLSYIEKRNKKVTDYFWEMDGHHNPEGYEMMAQTVFENITPLLKDTTTGW